MADNLANLDAIKIAIRNRIWHRAKYREGNRTAEEQKTRDAECEDIIYMLEQWENPNG